MSPEYFLRFLLIIYFIFNDFFSSYREHTTPPRGNHDPIFTKTFHDKFPTNFHHQIKL